MTLRDTAATAADLGVPGGVGVGFLLTGLALPDALGGLTATVIGVVTVAVTGVVMVSREAIEAWEPRRVRRHLIGAMALGVGLLTVCFFLHTLVVAEYPWGDESVSVFVPAVVADGHWRYPYDDCRDSDSACGDPVRRLAPTAEAVAVIKASGQDEVLVPREGPWYLWAAGLVGTFALGAAALVYLAGLLRVRGLGGLAAGPAPEDDATSDTPAPDAS